MSMVVDHKANSKLNLSTHLHLNNSHLETSQSGTHQKNSDNGDSNNNMSLLPIIKGEKKELVEKTGPLTSSMQANSMQAKYRAQQKAFRIKKHPNYVPDLTYRSIGYFVDYLLANNEGNTHSQPVVLKELISSKDQEHYKKYWKSISKLLNRGWILRDCEDMPGHFVFSFLYYTWDFETESNDLEVVHTLFKPDDEGYLQMYTFEGDDCLPQFTVTENEQLKLLRYKTVEELIAGEMDLKTLDEEVNLGSSINKKSLVTFTKLLKHNLTLKDYMQYAKLNKIIEDLEEVNGYFINTWKTVTEQHKIQNERIARVVDKENLLYEDAEIRDIIEEELDNLNKLRTIAKELKNLVKDQMNKYIPLTANLYNENEAAKDKPAISVEMEKVCKRMIDHKSGCLSKMYFFVKFLETLKNQINAFLGTSQQELEVLEQRLRLLRATKDSLTVKEKFAPDFMKDPIIIFVTDEGEGRGNRQTKKDNDKDEASRQNQVLPLASHNPFLRNTPTNFNKKI